MPPASTNESNDLCIIETPITSISAGVLTLMKLDIVDNSVEPRIGYSGAENAEMWLSCVAEADAQQPAQPVSLIWPHSI